MPRLALAQSSGYGRLLILVELKGGNDGLNTVVPYADPAYYALRPRLGVPRDQVLQLDPRTGLHPALKPLLPLWEARELAIVQGVGYANPNLSHFRSIEIWDTASASEQYLSEGWLARCFAAAPPPAAFAADGIVVGGNDMGPLAGTGARVLALNDPAQFQRQARLANPSGGAPRNAALAHILKIESGHRHGGGPPRGRRGVPDGISEGAVRQRRAHGGAAGGQRRGCRRHPAFAGRFRHAPKPGGHAGAAAGRIRRRHGGAQERAGREGALGFALVATYAEFGRRPRENDTSGTDHGTAAAHFVAGGRVRGGLYGDAPQLDALEGGNLRFAVDFRSLYATAIDGWWGIDSSRVLGGRYRPLELLKKV